MKQGWIEVEEDHPNVPNAGTQKSECSKKEDDGHGRSNTSFSPMKGSLTPMKQAWSEDEGDQRNGPSLRARLNKALQEQEQAYVRIVEEWRLQVGQIEASSLSHYLFLAQRNLAEAEAQLTRFRGRNSQTNSHGNASASLSGSEPVKVVLDLDEGENNQEREHLNDGIAISKPVGIPREQQNGRFASETREPPTTKYTHGDKSCIPTSISDPIAVHEGTNLLAVNSNGVSERERTKEKASREQARELSLVQVQQQNLSIQGRESQCICQQDIRPKG